MKKTLIIFMLLVLGCVPVSAAGVEEDAQAVADSFAKLAVRVDAGMRYQEYNADYNRLSEQVAQFEDKYADKADKNIFHRALNAYTDARDLWAALQGKTDKFNKMLVAERYRSDLVSKYPGIDERVEKLGMRWDGDSALQVLLQYAAEYQKDWK